MEAYITSQKVVEDHNQTQGNQVGNKNKLTPKLKRNTLWSVEPKPKKRSRKIDQEELKTNPIKVNGKV